MWQGFWKHHILLKSLALARALALALALALSLDLSRGHDGVVEERCHHTGEKV